MAEEKRTAFEENDPKVDSSLPIEDILSGINGKKESTNNEATVKEAAPIEEKLSPLEELRRQQQKPDGGAGMVISNEELEKGASQPVKDMVHTDERMEDFQKHMDELDETLDKRNSVIIVKQPTNYAEYIQMIDEIESVSKREDGSLFFDLKDDEGEPTEPVFCRLRLEDEGAFDFSTIPDFKEETSGDDSTDEDGDETKEEAMSPEKKKMVEVLIDKTGFGTDFMFTEEEREKLTEAESIRVNEVKLLDINAIKAKRSNKSFQDVIQQYDTSGSRVTICFPASGFKAQMKGLSYGEYADIALSMETVTFDQYYKRLSVIYNKMTNISTGPFEDFEDFLKHFAYTDIQLALYAMYVATEKENQEISLRCGNTTGANRCGLSFNWKYTTRSILRLDRCADTFLKKMEEIATAPGAEFDRIKDEAAVNDSKFIELPESKFVCELGVASAYDFLYNFIPLMNEETFKTAFGDDVNEIYQNNVLLLTALRSIRIPDGNGDYIECYGYKDILDAIYHVSPSEIQILAAYVAKIQTHYEMTFSFGDVVCPHCKTVTKNLDISMDDLVFQTYNRLMNTEIDLTKIQDL